MGAESPRGLAGLPEAWVCTLIATKFSSKTYDTLFWLSQTSVYTHTHLSNKKPVLQCGRLRPPAPHGDCIGSNELEFRNSRRYSKPLPLSQFLSVSAVTWTLEHLFITAVFRNSFIFCNSVMGTLTRICWLLNSAVSEVDRHSLCSCVVHRALKGLRKERGRGHAERLW